MEYQEAIYVVLAHIITPTPTDNLSSHTSLHQVFFGEEETLLDLNLYSVASGDVGYSPACLLLDVLMGTGQQLLKGREH